MPDNKEPVIEESKKLSYAINYEQVWLNYRLNHPDKPILNKQDLPYEGSYTKKTKPIYDYQYYIKETKTEEGKIQQFMRRKVRAQVGERLFRKYGTISIINKSSVIRKQRKLKGETKNGNNNNQSQGIPNA